MLQSTIKELSELETKTENVKKAIEHVTGVPFEVWHTSKKRENIICKELFVYYARKQKIVFRVIAQYLHEHTHSAAKRLEDSYRNDYQTNPEFRAVANRVGEILMGVK